MPDLEEDFTKIDEKKKRMSMRLSSSESKVLELKDALIVAAESDGSSQDFTESDASSS